MGEAAKPNDPTCVVCGGAMVVHLCFPWATPLGSGTSLGHYTLSQRKWPCVLNPKPGIVC